MVIIVEYHGGSDGTLFLAGDGFGAIQISSNYPRSFFFPETISYSVATLTSFGGSRVGVLVSV